MKIRIVAAAAMVLLLPAACSHPSTPPVTSAPTSQSATTHTETTRSATTQPPPTITAPTTTPTGTAGNAGTTSSSTSSTQSAADIVTTHVYYVVDTRVGLRLARELRDVPRGGGGPAAAVADMIAGAQDPDYTSTWNRATRVLGVQITPQLITVDLSSAARTANVGSPGAAMMIQQLIWTVTEAAGQPNTAVRLAIDGTLAGELWGAVSWEAPITREEPAAIRTPVQIDIPREGAKTASPVTISGDAAAFEANVPWRILGSGGTVVASGHTLTSEGMTFAPYSFTVDLPAGGYTVEVSQDDPSGGAAGPPLTDTRHFTVVG